MAGAVEEVLDPSQLEFEGEGPGHVADREVALYLVRLEQGRDRRPSGQVLAALAAALRLDEADRALLRRLAAASLGPDLCPAGTPARQVRPTVEALLRRLEPAPAFVLNRLTDLLAWTEAYAALAQPLGILDGEPPNLVRYTFTDARARDTYPDWDAIADEQVANLRVGCRTTDPASAALLDDLTRAGGDAFADRWAGPALEVKASGTKRLTHPEVGELAVAFETLQLPDADDQRLVVYLAADEATAAALDRLAGRGPRPAAGRARLTAGRTASGSAVAGGWGPSRWAGRPRLPPRRDYPASAAPARRRPRRAASPARTAPRTNATVRSA